MKKIVKQFHLLIQGDVVGVGYRSWMKREAEKLGIVGWVKNRSDGVVEAIVQGDEEVVGQIIKKVKAGPDIAWVKEVKSKEQSVNRNLFTFEVIY